MEVSSPTRHMMPVFPHGKTRQHSSSTRTALSDLSEPHVLALLSQHCPPPKSFYNYPTVNTRIITNFPHPQVANHHEHSLRRKTPNGTIDNGYDGSPTQLAAGPPPQKYMISTPSGEVFTNTNPGYQASPTYPVAVASNSTWLPLSQSVRDTRDVVFSQGSMGYSPVHGSLLPSPSAQVHPLIVAPGMRNGFGNAYQNQMLASPSAMSPGSFSPATASWVVDGPYAGFHQGGQLSAGYPPHNIPYESGFNSVQAPLPQGPLSGHGFGQNSPFQMPVPSYMLDDGFPRHNGPPPMNPFSHGVHDLSLAPSLAGNGGGSQQSFKENVLVTAHKAFCDLVGHVNRVKKAHHGKSSSRSARNIIFPKPPKHLVARPTSQLQRAHQSFHGTANSYSHRHEPALHGTSIVSRTGACLPDMMPSSRLDGNGRLFCGHPTMPMPGPVYGTAMVQKHPVETAKASLEILSSVCEQTDWKWVDGMLMGGCLLYSLERYEEALEWFKRIVGLDAK